MRGEDDNDGDDCRTTYPIHVPREPALLVEEAQLPRGEVCKRGAPKRSRRGVGLDFHVGVLRLEPFHAIHSAAALLDEVPLVLEVGVGPPGEVHGAIGGVRLCLLCGCETSVAAQRTAHSA